MTKPEHPKRSGNDEPEQWHVVDTEPPMFDLCSHVWKLVRLRNQAGQLSAGVQCSLCGDVERVTNAQLRRHGSLSYRSDK